MAEIDQWLVFMDTLETTREHAEFAKRVAQSIALTKVPLTQLTGEGAIQMSWDSGRYYFDVDVFPDGLEWFFRDRETKVIEGTDDERVAELPPDAMRFLGLILHD